MDEGARLADVAEFVPAHRFSRVALGTFSLCRFSKRKGMLCARSTMFSNHTSRWTTFLSLLALALLAAPGSAQTADDKDLAFWSKSTVAKPAAAAQLV